MAEFETASAYDIVTLIDRAATGVVVENGKERPLEIIHDGKRIAFAKGQIERPVPQFLAEWLFGAERHMVNTIDGQYVCRFAVKDAPEDLVARLGAHIADDSPIEIDTKRIELLPADYASERGAARTVQLRPNPADFANLAGPTAASFGKER